MWWDVCKGMLWCNMICDEACLDVWWLGLVMWWSMLDEW